MSIRGQLDHLIEAERAEQRRLMRLGRVYVLLAVVFALLGLNFALDMARAVGWL